MVIDVATEPKVARLRDELPAVRATGYFNAGSNGPIPAVVQETLLRAAAREMEVGRIVPGLYESNRERNRRVAGVVASLLGAATDEIALTHASTEGLGIVLMGIRWHPGDEVVTTNLEHPGLLVPLSLLSHRFGVVLRAADIGMGGGDVASAIEAAMTPRTRMVALSHLMWSTGAVMPLRELADVAHRRNALLLVDGAQSAGQIPLDLAALGADAYAVSGQKWLCGPEATGALYVRRDRFPDVLPSYLRYADFDETGFVIPKPGANRYEVGEFYGPALEGWEAALLWLRDEVDLDWACARTAELGRRFWQALRQIDGVTLLTPPERMAGLVNFTVAGRTPQAVAAALFERNLTIRYVVARPCPPSARAAIAWWNTEEEVDRLAEAVADLAADAGPEPDR